MTKYAAHELSCCENLIQWYDVDYHWNYEGHFEQKRKLKWLAAELIFSQGYVLQEDSIKAGNQGSYAKQDQR